MSPNLGFTLHPAFMVPNFSLILQCHMTASSNNGKTAKLQDKIWLSRSKLIINPHYQHQKKKKRQPKKTKTKPEKILHKILLFYFTLFWMWQKSEKSPIRDECYIDTEPKKKLYSRNCSLTLWLQVCRKRAERLQKQKKIDNINLKNTTKPSHRIAV